MDSVLALKFCNECKQMGKNGSMKYGGITKPSGLGKNFFKRNTEAFMNSSYRSQSMNEKSHDGFPLDHNLCEDFSIGPSEMVGKLKLTCIAFFDSPF